MQISTRAPIPSGIPVVSYVVRDQLVKIGRTGDFIGRMQGLRPDHVLAVEPGGEWLEAFRHTQFAAHNVPGPDGETEWFAPADEILEHAALVAGMYEPPTVDRARPAEKPIHVPDGSIRLRSVKLVSTNEAAKAVGVHLRSLQRWTSHGLLKPDQRTPGGHARWNVERLSAAMRDPALWGQLTE